MFYEQSFGKFVYVYYLEHKDQLKKYKTPLEFANEFKPDESAWRDLIEISHKDSISLDHLTEKEKLEVEKRMKVWLARQIWRMEGYYVVNNTSDPAVLKAIEILSKK